MSQSHAHCVAVLSEQDPLRRPGSLRPSSQPRAGRTRPRRRGVLRPALPRGPRPAGAAAPRCPASTCTASPTRSGSRGPARSATGSTCSSCSRRGRPASPSPRRSACAPRAAAGRAPRRLRRRARQPVPRHRPAEDRRASGLPVVATVHHPITRDRVLDVAAARWWRKPLVRRWYGFAEMQKHVARQIPELLTVSSTSAADIAEDFGVSSRPAARRAARCRHRRCSSPREPRVRNRIIAIASADVPLKGVSHLLHAVARLRVERDLELQLVAQARTATGPTEKLIAELGISDIVHSSSGLSDAELADLLASAEVACIPSLYEGFSLPAVEAMASGTPIVASRAGALPEVVGADGECARLVTPGRRRRADQGARRTARLAAGTAHGSARTAGSARSTCSAGNPLRRRRSRCTSARMRAGRAHADRRLRPARRRRRHQGDRRRLRRGQALASRRTGAAPTSSRSTRTHADLNDVDEILQAMKDAGRGARVGARRRRSRATRSTCPTPTARSTASSPRRSSSTSRRTTGRSPNWSGCSNPVARWRSRCRAGCPRRICWVLSDEYHANEGGHIRIYRADELRDKVARPRPAAHPHPSRARAALAVLVAEMRCRSREIRSSRGDGLPQAAGVGHDAAARG